MQLLRADEFHPEPDDTVFRERVVGRIVAVMLFTAIGVAWMLAPLARWLVVPAWIGWAVAFVFGMPCLLVGALSMRPVWRGLARDHWVLRVRQSGIALCLRSYLNADPARGGTCVAWIPSTEIRCVRRGSVTRHLPEHRSGTRREDETYLDIELTHASTTELVHALAQERANPRPGRAHFSASCIRLARPDAIRVTWRDAHVALRPGLARALDALAASATVADAAPHADVDARLLDEKASDDCVLELCEKGARIEAIQVLRQKRGMDLTSAKKLVDELCSGTRAA